MKEKHEAFQAFMRQERENGDELAQTCVIQQIIGHQALNL
jgi:hypothetical protein